MGDAGGAHHGRHGVQQEQPAGSGQERVRCEGGKASLVVDNVCLASSQAELVCWLLSCLTEVYGLAHAIGNISVGAGA